nr:MAG TPA: hypothetical protein [Caudoviricetes sp.]
MLSWTNWATGQGDDQGPTVRRSERSGAAHTSPKGV